MALRAADGNGETRVVDCFPAGLLERPRLTTLEYELLAMCPRVQVFTGDSGVEYVGFDLEERIVFRFITQRAVWNREDLGGVLDACISARLPWVKARAWEVHVITLGEDVYDRYADGEWTKKRQSSDGG